MARHSTAEPGLVTAPADTQVTAARWRGWFTLDRACDLTAALLILVALLTGLHAVSGLRWPSDPDHFRDIAFARTALDGHPLSDASYPGEWIWYNPLLPWLVAIGSAITGAVPAVVHVAGGPYLNLLGPIAFYALGVRMAGRPAALIALTLVLFFMCREDCWACATYSPWLFTSTFTQGLFYASMMAVLAAAGRRTVLAACGAGVLVGLTFLSHTAPALILALVAAATLPPRLVVACGAAAAIVAAPFIVAIAGHYHLRVVNTVPLTWHYGPLMWPALIGTVGANAVWFAGAAAGLYWLRSRATVAWIGAAALLVLTGLFPTPVVPPFHFWIYLMAAAALLTGVVAARVLVRPETVIVITILAVMWHWPAYAGRQDFTVIRGVALDRDPNYAAMTAVIRSQSLPDDVVLGTYGAANLIIGPAGRKVVAPQAAMSNPYVPLEPRQSDRDAMLKAVREHDPVAFGRLAGPYHVALVLSVGTADCAAAETFEPLVAVQRLGDVCLSRVRH